MARSTYVYTVQEPMTRNVVGAFTVKYEMLEWAQKGPISKLAHVYRHRDGHPTGGAYLGTIRSLLEEETDD